MESNEADFIDVDALQYRIAGFPDDISKLANGLPYIATIDEQAIQADINEEQTAALQLYCDLFVSNNTGASHEDIFEQYGIADRKPLVLSGGNVLYIPEDGLVIVRDDAHPIGEDPPPVRRKIARAIGRKVKDLLRVPVITFKAISHAERVSILWKGLKNKIATALRRKRNQ